MKHIYVFTSLYLENSMREDVQQGWSNLNFYVVNKFSQYETIETKYLTKVTDNPNQKVKPRAFTNHSKLLLQHTKIFREFLPTFNPFCSTFLNF